MTTAAHLLGSSLLLTKMQLLELASLQTRVKGHLAGLLVVFLCGLTHSS